MEQVREVGAMTDDLVGFARWLVAPGVGTVALRSTGVHWIPVSEVLEQYGLKVWLVDARQMKDIPGRKSDVQNCQRLQKLMRRGCCAPPGVRVPRCACCALSRDNARRC